MQTKIAPAHTTRQGNLFLLENQYMAAWEFSARDYECDLQGIVNNVAYQNYLEQALCELLKSIRLNWAQLYRAGKDFVVSRMEIDYKSPLKSGDQCAVRSNFQRADLKFVCDQSVFRLPDEKHILQAKAIGVCLQNYRSQALDGTSQPEF